MHGTMNIKFFDGIRHVVLR